MELDGLFANNNTYCITESNLSKNYSGNTICTECGYCMEEED